MRPPFKPTVGRPEDTFHFDPEFTSRTPTGNSKHTKTHMSLDTMKPLTDECAVVAIIDDAFGLGEKY